MIVWRIFDEKLRPFMNEALKINHHVHGYVATLILLFSLTYCCYFTLTN